jgi:hypothetical protein
LWESPKFVLFIYLFILFFRFCDGHHWLGCKKKLVKLWRLPKYTYCSLFLFSCLYKSREWNLGQRIWDNVRCYWEHVKNPVGTWSKHIENQKNPNNPTFPHPPQKTKILGPLVHASQFIGCQEFLCLPLFFLIFVLKIRPSGGENGQFRHTRASNA